MARIKMIKPGETIGLQLDADQREAILALKLARPDIRDRIRQTPESQEIRLTFDQWDELAGRIAGEAHLTDDRRLHRIARKIDRLIETYFVGEPESEVFPPLPSWPGQALDSHPAGAPPALPRGRRRGGGREMALKLTEHQRRTILDHVPLTEGMKDRLTALPGGQQVVVLSPEDLDDLQVRVGRAIQDAKYPPKKVLQVALKRIARVRAEQGVEELERSATDPCPEAAHEVLLPLSASERRLILESTDLENEISKRLRAIEGQEGGVRLSISELVKLAIATAGCATRPMSGTDRKKLDRLSDRIHEVVASCLRTKRPGKWRETRPGRTAEGKDDKQ